MESRAKCGALLSICTSACHRCGWNPVVAHQRVEKRYGKNAWEKLSKIVITMEEVDRINISEKSEQKCEGENDEQAD